MEMKLLTLQGSPYHNRFGLTTRNCLMRRSRAVALQLFRTKSPDQLIAEAEAPDRQMKRTLGPLALTCIGIGAVIGAGIFSLTGTAAAGQTFASGL